jgi:hypothetical protein
LDLLYKLPLNPGPIDPCLSRPAKTGAALPYADHNPDVYAPETVRDGRRLGVTAISGLVDFLQARIVTDRPRPGSYLAGLIALGYCYPVRSYVAITSSVKISMSL